MPPQSTRPDMVDLGTHFVPKGVTYRWGRYEGVKMLALPAPLTTSATGKPRSHPACTIAKLVPFRRLTLLMLISTIYSIVSMIVLSKYSHQVFLPFDGSHEGEIYLTNFLYNTTMTPKRYIHPKPTHAASIQIARTMVSQNLGIKAVESFLLYGMLEEQFQKFNNIVLRGGESIWDVRDGTFRCLTCQVSDLAIPLDTAYQVVMQRRNMPLLAEDREVLKMQRYYWWMVHGEPLFVETTCGFKVPCYFSTRLKRLLVTDTRKERPPFWDEMLWMIQELADNQVGISRIDFLVTPPSPTRQVYFSSISSDTSNLPPALLNLLHGVHESNLWMSPSHVERILNEDTWVLVAFPQLVSTHKSVSALCHEAKELSNSENICSNHDMVAMEEDFPIRCLSLNRQRDTISVAVGQWRVPTFTVVLSNIDWPWILGLSLVLMILKLANVGGTATTHTYSSLVLLLYLFALVIYKSKKPENLGLFSPQPIYTTLLESIQAFIFVHPLSSPWIVWSHIATYWLEIAAWRSSTIQGVLFWYLMYEIFASYADEHVHMLEEDNAIRCTRVSFLLDMKQYAVEDVVRTHLLPPLLVYLYLLPQILLHWLIPFWSS